MLYLASLAVMFVWMLALLYNRKPNPHALVAAYAIPLITADLCEVTFNLLLDLYKFPTYLRNNPIDDNELGIVLGDMLILPITFIVFIYLAVRSRHSWRITLLFAAGFTVLELVYLKLGYMRYIHWNLAISGAFYLVAFRIGIYLAPRIAHYKPPIPYRFALFCFCHTAFMWMGVIFSLPLLKWYKFDPGIFANFMADSRFVDLLSGLVLGLLCVIFIPLARPKMKLVILAAVACLGIAFAQFAYYGGWLVYMHWNHWLMALRYIVPLVLIGLYDRWEAPYRARRSIFRTN